jgi:hypothetical protein
MKHELDKNIASTSTACQSVKLTAALIALLKGCKQFHVAASSGQKVANR